MKSLKEPAPRLARWLIRLYEYDFEILYKRGCENGNADALSRMPADIPDDSQIDIDPGIVINSIKLSV